MNAEKFQVKFFTKNPDVEVESLIPVFHDWIREKKIDDELLIDVADYAHVPQGPGVVLIGHQSDYYLDMGDDRPGMLYSRKRGFEGSLQARLSDAFARALRACALLEGESRLALNFGTEEALVRVQDRLAAPNTDEGFEQIRPALESVAQQILGPNVSLSRDGEEAKGPLTVRVTGGTGDGVEAALARA